MIDNLTKEVLMELGIDEYTPAHWLPNVHKAIDRTTGEIVRQYPSGFFALVVANNLG